MTDPLQNPKDLYHPGDKIRNKQTGKEMTVEVYCQWMYPPIVCEGETDLFSPDQVELIEQPGSVSSLPASPAPGAGDSGTQRKLPETLELVNQLLRKVMDKRLADQTFHQGFLLVEGQPLPIPGAVHVCYPLDRESCLVIELALEHFTISFEKGKEVLYSETHKPEEFLQQAGTAAQSCTLQKVSQDEAASSSPDHRQEGQDKPPASP